MITITKRYRIDVLDQQFELNGEVLSNQTVLVDHFNELGQITESRKYGKGDLDSVYQCIHDRKPVDLSFLYIDSFSLSDYRTKFNVGETELIEIIGFKAESSFFDSDTAVDFAYSRFDSDNLIFKHSRFGDCDLNFYNVRVSDCDVDFSNVDFGNGNVNFQFSEFGNGYVTFENASFKAGNISFINSNFGAGGVSFKYTEFGHGNVDFHYSKFGDGEVSFDKAIFLDGNVDFRRVEFGIGKVEFRRVHFGNGNISFEEAEFNAGKVSFRHTIFGEGNVSFEMANLGSDVASFERAEFGTGEVSFHKCIFNILTFRHCHINNYLDLRVERGNIISLDNTVVRDVVDLIPFKSSVDIKLLYLTGMRNLGRIFIDWKKNRVREIIGNQPDSSLQEKADQFNLLKADFNSTGKYNDEDKAYVAFKRFEAQARLKTKLAEKKSNAIWIYPEHYFKALVFDKMGLYATSPLRVLISSFAFVFIFAFIYELLPLISDSGISCGGSDNESLGVFAKSVYYSAITFLTIGYGDCLPSGVVHWLAPMEGWTGVFLMSYFTVAFVRKVLR